MPIYTAIVTVLVVVFFFFIATRVAVARRTYDVKLPATSGPPEFERVLRVHMNTLEWMPIFLPLLWLCAIYFGDATAAVLGLVWIGGRTLYWVGYTEAVEKRVPGFFIQAAACMLLFLGSIAGIVMHLARG